LYYNYGFSIARNMKRKIWGRKKEVQINTAAEVIDVAVWSCQARRSL